MPFVDAKRWAMRLAKHPESGKRLAYGLDFAPAGLSKGKGVPCVRANLFGVPVTLAPRGHGKPVKATETAHGHSFELSNPGILTFEERDELVFPDRTVWRPDNGGLLKTTLVIDAKPARPRWEFDLGLPPGCHLAYQPAVTSEQRDLGCSQPDWAVGSFALFDQTGLKIGHIPNATLKDADGRWTFGRMDFDRATGVLGVEVDAAWLDAARLPIEIDPSMGYATAGASTTSLAADNMVVFHVGGGAGVATAFWMYGSSSIVRPVTQGLYVVAGTRVVDTAGGNGPTTAAWFSQNADANTTLTNGLDYLYGHDHDDGTMLINYDAMAGGWPAGYAYAASAYSAGALPANLPNPLTYSATVGTFRYSAYVAVTAPVFPAAAKVWFDAGAYGEASETTPLMRASSIANCSTGNIRDGVTVDDVAGTYSPGGTYVQGQAAQYATDQAEVTSKADHLQNTETICGIAGTLDMSPWVLKTDVISASWVVTGNTNYVGGSAGTYPTTATSQAAQLAADQVTVLANAGYIQLGHSILSQAGTLDTAALEAAAAAAQLVTDKAAVTAGKADILNTRTILTVTGTLDIDLWVLKTDVVAVEYIIEGHKQWVATGGNGTYHEAAVAEVQNGVHFGAGSVLVGNYGGDYGEGFADGLVAQLADDVSEVTSAVAGITTTTTILGVTGALDMSDYVLRVRSQSAGEVGLLMSFARQWERSAEAVDAVPFDRFITGRIPSTREFPFPYISVIPGSSRLMYRSDKYEGLRRTVSVHIWVDPARLETGEEIAEIVRRTYASQAWSYDFGKVIDVLDGGHTAHEINDPTFQAWELVRILTLCIEQSRVDDYACASSGSAGSEAASSSEAPVIVSSSSGPWS